MVSLVGRSISAFKTFFKAVCRERGCSKIIIFFILHEFEFSTRLLFEVLRFVIWLLDECFVSFIDDS